MSFFHCVSDLASELTSESTSIVNSTIGDLIGDGGVVPGLPEGGDSNMWEKLTSGIGSFITGAFTPVMEVISTSEIALAFLSVSFFFLAVRGVRKTVGAFGRGR